MSQFNCSIAFSPIAQMITNSCKTVGQTSAAPANPLQNAPGFGDREDMQEPLKVLQKLCDFPVLHFNFHVEREEDGNPKNFIATLSDKEPAVDESYTATYPSDSIKVDIAVVRISESSLKNLDFWGNMFCSILTFRGHEVFYNGKLYNPFIR